MMICLPRFFVSTAVSGRANASVPPPLGNGTTIVTGRVGQPLPCARTSGVASSAPVPSTSWRRDGPRKVAGGCMGCLRLLWVRGSEQRADRARVRDVAAHELLVVHLDLLQVIQVVDH